MWGGSGRTCGSETIWPNTFNINFLNNKNTMKKGLIEIHLLQLQDSDI